MKWPPPRILSGLPLTEEIAAETLLIMQQDFDINKYTPKGDALTIGIIEPFTFCRFLAKIAHSFAVGKLGGAHFRPYLAEIVLGKPDVLISRLYQLIDCGQNLPDNSLSDPTLRTLHRLQVHGHDDTGVEYVVVSIQLFSFLKAPTYYVVVGENQQPKC
jgi:hypothetical protein